MDEGSVRGVVTRARRGVGLHLLPAAETERRASILNLIRGGRGGGGGREVDERLRRQDPLTSVFKCRGLQHTSEQVYLPRVLGCILGCILILIWRCSYSLLWSYVVWDSWASDCQRGSRARDDR